MTSNVFTELDNTMKYGKGGLIREPLVSQSGDLFVKSCDATSGSLVSQCCDLCVKSCDAITGSSVSQCGGVCYGTCDAIRGC